MYPIKPYRKKSCTRQGQEIYIIDRLCLGHHHCTPVMSMGAQITPQHLHQRPAADSGCPVLFGKVVSHVQHASRFILYYIFHMMYM